MLQDEQLKSKIKLLDRGDVEQVIFAINSLSVQTEQVKEDINREIGYFDKNKKECGTKTLEVRDYL